MIKEYFAGIWRDRFVLFSLINQDLQRKYNRSVLGIAWAVLTPLGLVLIIGGVYSIIFRSDPTVFIPLLFTGLNPWLCINISADGGALAFLSAEGYLKQTTVNAQIFPFRVTAVAFINLLYSILAFFAVYLFLKPDNFGPLMLMFIPGILLLFFFCLALANIAAIMNLNVRDFQPLQNLILQGLFYATPIIFMPEMLAEKGFEIVYEINPFYYLIEVVRRPMLGIELPSFEVYVVAILITIVFFLISVRLVMKSKKGIPFKL